MNQELTIPDQSVMMQTNRDFRLSSLNGYVVNFEANVPTRVPPNCYLEAVGIGAILSEEQPEPREIVEEKTVADESIAEAAKLETEAKYEYIKQACMKLMAIGDSTSFRADGVPKAAKLAAEMAPEAPRVTASEIEEVWLVLQKDIDLIEDVED